MDEFNIHSLHGQYFTAEICFTDVVGRISVNEDGMVFLCQDSIAGSGLRCRDFFGYKHSFYFGKMENMGEEVQKFKILPSPIEYHAFLGELIDYCNKFDDPEIPMSKVSEFLDNIKVFDPKDLGK